VLAEILAAFPAGYTPRPAQARLLAQLADAIAEAGDDRNAPRVFLVEAPPGVGKSHLAMTLAHWSGSAYLLTSQKMLQDQYEREFADQIQVVKGRDNYPCERYPGARVTTSHGMCRRPGGPPCRCPYARARAAALAGPVFCSNTAYFLTLRQWQDEQLPTRRMLIVDEAHTLEAQLTNVFTLSFTPEQMKAWFGGPLPRLPAADDYRALMAEHVERLEREVGQNARLLDSLRGTWLGEEFLLMPPSREEQDLRAQRDTLQNTLARLRYFVEADDQEWVLRYPEGIEATLELVPLEVSRLAPQLLFEAADLVVLSSAYLGRHEALAEYFGLDLTGVRAFGADSPFPLAQRPIVYRPIGALSRATLAELEPALFHEVAAIMSRHIRDKGLIHAASYRAARRLERFLAEHAPAEHRRLIAVGSSSDKPGALEHHRTSPHPTVLLSPSLREGVDLPDDFLRFQILTKMPFPDLGDPWTKARFDRDPRWYALETAKALVQAYGRSCRHDADEGVTYVLDAQFARFVTRHRVLLPSWFLDAADAALRDYHEREQGDG
jgi:Rad3-related DNA helicase